MATITKPLVVYLPDTRGVELSRWGKGNLKIGPNVYTYSRLPGLTGRYALGTAFVEGQMIPAEYWGMHGTCPGATTECQRICYARRPVQEHGIVADMWIRNAGEDVPPIPEGAKIVRAHVSGDFDTVPYIENWIVRLTERPDVKFWAYTRSWRVAALLPALERLRALPNVQLFASMDVSTPELPPTVCPECDGRGQILDAPLDVLDGRTYLDLCPACRGRYQPWRRAWIDGDPRAGVVHRIPAHGQAAGTFAMFELQQTEDKIKALICPEETKHVPNCEACGFCISGLRNDVVFLEH